MLSGFHAVALGQASLIPGYIVENVSLLKGILTFVARELVISRHQLVANAEVHGSQFASFFPIFDVGGRRKAAFVHFFHIIFVSNLLFFQ